MGMFSIFSKKKKDEAPAPGDSLDLPPPPSPDGPSSDVRIVSELPDITSVPAPPLQMQQEEQHDEAPPAPEITVPRIRRAPLPMPVAEEETPEAKAPSNTSNEPLFISAGEYQEVLTSIAYVRAKLGEADELIKKLNDVKSKEEKGFDQWQAQLEDLQRKLAYVEDVIVAAG